MTQQGDRQASVRAVTTTTGTYEGDWHALFDATGIATGDFDGRMLAWVNQKLGVTYTQLDGALNAYAVANGARDFQSLGTCDVAIYDAASKTLFAAMTTQPTLARKQLIDTCIRALKTAGVFAKLDWLHVMAAADSQAAIVNWINPGTYNASLVNSPTFTADRGFAGDGATSYVDSGFNPTTAVTPNYVQNSAIFGVWSRTAAQTSTGAGWFDGTDGVSLNTRNASDQLAARMSNATQYLVTAVNIDGSGFYTVNRSGSATGNVQVYKNAVSKAYTGGSASVALNNNNLFYGRATAASFSPDQWAAGLGGGSLTAQNNTDLYNALQTYMTAVGA